MRKTEFQGKIIKRDGRNVIFDRSRIASAIYKAFAEFEAEDIASTIVACTELVVLAMTHTEKTEIGVEEVQDIVEHILSTRGHKREAQCFSAYREHHAKTRESRTLEKIKNGELKIRLEDGSVEAFSLEAQREEFQLLSYGLEYIETDALVTELSKKIYNGMSIGDLDKLTIQVASDRIGLHYNHSFLAARIRIGQIQTRLHAKSKRPYFSMISEFPDYIRKGAGRLDPALLNFDLSRLSRAIHPERDYLFQYAGLTTLCDRYLMRDERKECCELPQWMWMRVAMGLSLNEKDKNYWAVQFYNVLSKMEVVPSTPTLFNAGTLHPQLSSCYLNTVADSLDGIFKMYADNARLSKWAGGVGTDFTPIRALGSPIKGTHGESQGVIPFIKIFNDVALAVNQGGKRKGAMVAYMEVWHKDIEQFLELKKNTGDERRRAHDINTACWIPDLFMKRVETEGDWTLFCPSDVKDLHDLYGRAFEERYKHYEATKRIPSRTIPAVDLWRKMLSMLHETGHPWITFKDAINIRNPQDHCGEIHSSNLCTEITLNTSKKETAVCNLASLNLAKMAKKETLLKAIPIAIRMLDNVIDVNFYPTKEAKHSNLKHRPIGLGVMGCQDAMFQQKIAFGTQKALDFADKSMEIISFHAIQASCRLAKERGAYSSFVGSKWDRGVFPMDSLLLLEEDRKNSFYSKTELSIRERSDWKDLKESVKTHGLRNSNLLAIAPTATISVIAGVTPCTEPIFSNLYMKENLSGNFVIVNRYLVDALVSAGLWSLEMLNRIKDKDGSIQHVKGIPIEMKNLYRTAFEVDPIDIIHMAVARGRFIDQAASTNIFVNTSSGQRLHNIYMEAWKCGLKTTYYLRTQGASQIDKAYNKEVCTLDNASCEACD